MTPEKFSVYNFAYGTNYFCESFHSRPKLRIRVQHPSMWSFAGHISHLMADTEKGLERLDRGLNVSRSRKKTYEANLERRNACKEKYANGQYSHMQSISAVAHTIDTHLLLLETAHTRDGYDSDDADEATVDQENQSSHQQNHRLCAVCLAPRERKICFRPWNHAQVCVGYNSVMEAIGYPCPICRGQMQDRFEIFIQ